jgi:hypothetical protein
MSAVGAAAAADQPAVIWRRQPISPTGGREVAIMAAGGSLEEDDKADRSQGESGRPPAVSLLRPCTSNTTSNGSERKASFGAVARAVRLSSSFQCQLSADVVDFRAPTPRPKASPPPAHQSESPMFQWKLSSPPPRRASPIPSGYINHRPVSPSLRQGIAACKLH